MGLGVCVDAERSKGKAEIDGRGDVAVREAQQHLNSLPAEETLGCTSVAVLPASLYCGGSKATGYKDARPSLMQQAFKETRDPSSNRNRRLDYHFSLYKRSRVTWGFEDGTLSYRATH